MESFSISFENIERIDDTRMIKGGIWNDWKLYGGGGEEIIVELVPWKISSIAQIEVEKLIRKIDLFEK